MIEQFTQPVELPLYAVLGLYAYRGEAKKGAKLARDRLKGRASGGGTTKSPE